MILITGADGFIGSQIVPLTKGKKFLLTENKYNLVTGKNLDKIPKNPEIIIHLAAATDTSKSDQRCNDIGTQNLIDILKNIGPKTHFVFTSSLAVYSGRKNAQKPIDKDTPIAPSNSYGKTKILAENILIKAAKKQKFGLTIVRLPTVWGDNPRKNSFLSFIKSLIKSKSIFSRLNYQGLTALINVNDAARKIVKLAKNPPKPGEIKICFLTAQNLRIDEIFKITSKSLGKKYSPINLPPVFWQIINFLENYINFLEPLMPANLYNYLWRAQIVSTNKLWCKVTSLSQSKLLLEDLGFPKKLLFLEKDQ